eukprot:3370305-Alexandrium_andersonii.AAC.1
MHMRVHAHHSDESALPSPRTPASGGGRCSPLPATGSLKRAPPAQAVLAKHEAAPLAASIRFLMQNAFGLFEQLPKAKAITVTRHLQKASPNTQL